MMLKFTDSEMKGKESFFKEEDFKVSEKILVAKKNTHRGSIHAWAECGLAMLDLGNGYGLQIITHGDDFPTIQLYKFGLNQTITNQTYTRTKTEYVKKEKKQNAPKFEIKEEVKTKDLFEFEGD